MPDPLPPPPPQPTSLPWYRQGRTDGGPPPLRRTGARTRRRRGILSQRRSLHALLIAIVVLSGVGMAAAVVGYAGYNSYLSQLPNPATLAAMEPPLDSHVYARDGKTLLATFHDPNFRHQHVQLNDVALAARQATVDVEDRHFYDEASWDLPRLVKAGVNDVTGSGPIQGASTITEQLAKISFLPSERSIDRKIKQLILGNQIEGNFTKDQILEMYLNRIPYGNHAVGIGTAAQLYFHKAAKDLDLAESSMLAGLPNSPTDFNPLIHDPGASVNPQAKDRQRTVLDAMVSVGDVTQAQADNAFAEPLTYHSWEEGQGVIAPDFLDYLRKYLDTNYGDAYIRPGGWEIYTTLDATRQQAAETALHDGVAAVRDKFNAHDGSLVSIDPKNGEVLALVGTWDYADPGVGQLNMALRPVQPGSTIKVFTYAAALASRQFTITTPIVDAPFSPPLNSGGGPYQPLNYDRKYHGVCQLKSCLGNSFNVPAVRVEQATGIPYITNVEIAAGLTALRDPDNRPGPRDYAATLGGLKHGISPLDLAGGAATMGALGVHHDPTPVLRIIDVAAGRYNYTHDAAAKATRVMPAGVAYIINQITSNDANRLTEFGPKGALTLPDRRVSAKTGTTEFFVANWTVGWTPDVATAVWVGNPQPSCLKNADQGRLAGQIAGHMLYPDQKIDDPYSPADLANYGLSPANDHCGHLEGATGITGAAPIWNAYMVKALAGTSKTWYTKPPDVVARGSGDDADFYLPGTEPAAGPQGCIPSGPSSDPTSICTVVPKVEPLPTVPAIPGVTVPGDIGAPRYVQPGTAPPGTVPPGTVPPGTIPGFGPGIVIP